LAISAAGGDEERRELKVLDELELRGDGRHGQAVGVSV